MHLLLVLLSLLPPSSSPLPPSLVLLLLPTKKGEGAPAPSLSCSARLLHRHRTSKPLADPEGSFGAFSLEGAAGLLRRLLLKKKRFWRGGEVEVEVEVEFFFPSVPSSIASHLLPSSETRTVFSFRASGRGDLLFVVGRRAVIRERFHF
jgi:hypothetical protein